MKPIIQISLPVITLTILLTGILRFNPIVIFVESEDNIPSIVQANAPVLKAGQVWKMGGVDNRNPFHKREPLSARIVAIKDGYVKYYFTGQENFGEWTTESRTAEDFAMIYTKRIK